MKRAHTVKFNDPYGLARANERKVGSRTVLKKSDGKRNVYEEEEEEEEDAKL